jgi:putative transposase
MCCLMKVSRSSYYEFLKGKVSNRTTENEYILKEIKISFKESKQTYGSPKIAHCLNSKGIKVSKVRVARLMRKNHIQSITRKKYVVTINSKHDFTISKNILDRNFNVDRPSLAWVSDINYVPTQEGWVYLTTVIDLYDRKVIGRSISDDMTAENTVIKAFKDALNKRIMTKETIFHSDRGVQYACKEFRKILKQHTMVQSMSRKGDCWEDLITSKVAESFFSSFKNTVLEKLNSSLK